MVSVASKPPQEFQDTVISLPSGEIKKRSGSSKSTLEFCSSCQRHNLLTTGAASLAPLQAPEATPGLMGCAFCAMLLVAAD